jgi:anthranilate phosphoribosyltransferase
MTERNALQEAIARLAAGGPLGRELAAAAMDTVMAGEASPAQIGAFLLGLQVKKPTVEEIVGCAAAIRARARPFPSAFTGLVDTCGTGGDGAGTFNISTTAAFIVAGAGVPVAKHGNRAVSSETGSADVLEALGVQVDMAGPEAAGALAEVGVTFLFAPTFHAAMRHAAPVRRELGVRTVFNVLGPLCNPAGATAQVVGVFDHALVRPLAEALAQLGARRALVVHGADGLDELTVTGPSYVAEWDGSDVREYVVEPRALGLPYRSPAELAGGGAPVNAAILRRVLEGGHGAPRDVALLNAAAGLVVAGQAPDLRAGLALAEQSVDSGAAHARVESLLAYSRLVNASAARVRVTSDVVAAGVPGWGQT